jgi:hypothetical protein
LGAQAPPGRLELVDFSGLLEAQREEMLDFCWKLLLYVGDFFALTRR